MLLFTEKLVMWSDYNRVRADIDGSKSCRTRNKFYFKEVNCRPAGFTLLELIMTIVILSLSSLILVPFFQSISHSPDPMMRQRAIALGQSMMDEILAKKWDENTPNGGGPICTTESNASRTSIADCANQAGNIGLDSGETTTNRGNWDDVDDYNDFLTETDTFKDQENNTFNLTGYSRAVSVRYIPSNSDPITATTPVGSTSQVSATDTKKIVVTVTLPLTETFSFVAVSCNF